MVGYQTRRKVELQLDLGTAGTRDATRSHFTSLHLKEYYGKQLLQSKYPFIPLKKFGFYNIFSSKLKNSRLGVYAQAKYLGSSG
jgi:hypothetical protein